MLGQIVAVKRMYVEDARVMSSAQRRTLRHEAKLWYVLYITSRFPAEYDLGRPSTTPTYVAFTGRAWKLKLYVTETRRTFHS